MLSPTDFSPHADRKRHRARRVAEKDALRRQSFRPSQRLSFSAMARDPFYRGIAAGCCPATLAANIRDLGFSLAADVAACGTPAALRARLADRAQPDDASLSRLLTQARREALRAWRLSRHALAVNDPMGRALLHTPAPLSQDSASTQSLPAYASPASLQSSQSPAAYLCHLYRIATGEDAEIGIRCPASSPFAIAKRRPDLHALVLSEANLKTELPTLELVNEVLRADRSVAGLAAGFHPLALPYDHAATRARTALAQLGNTRFNDIASRITSLPTDGSAGYGWARDRPGLMGVPDAVMPLLTGAQAASAERPATLQGLYGCTTRAAASGTDQLMQSLDQTFDGLTQLLGLYNVSREGTGSAAQRDFATAFLNNDAPFAITYAQQLKSATMAGEPLPAPVLRSLNILARLQRGTGLAYHDLNAILALPGAAADGAATGADDPVAPARTVTDAGVRLLASYPLYQEAFGLSPAGFAALFGAPCPYWRTDAILPAQEDGTALEQAERSFLRSLFHEDAPALQTLLDAGTTPVLDPDLAPLIARGLGLTALELDRLVAVLDASFALSQGLDARGLGGLYRVSTLCRMLGRPVLSGLALIDRLPGGPAALYLRNETAAQTLALCDALDWLVALSRWMTETGLTPDALCALLTPHAAPLGDAQIAWLGASQDAFAPIAAKAGVFAGAETWPGPEGGETTIAAETWHVHLASTASGPILRGSGVFYDDADRAGIEAACKDCLIAAGLDPAASGIAEPLRLLVARLDALRNAQAELIAAQVVSLDPGLSVVAAVSLIGWAQSRPLRLLHDLLAGPDDPTCLHWMSELTRHISAASALSLGEADLWLVAEHPDWLVDAPQSDRLGLAQLYHLQRFGTLQVGVASDAAWVGYLAQSQDSPSEAEAPGDLPGDWVTGCRQVMALMLGCATEDADVYLDALLGPGRVAQSVAEIDAVARHVRLADDLGLSAADLLALTRVSDPGLETQTSPHRGDAWQAAASAAQASLSRPGDEQGLQAFQNALAERHRDALVADFMQNRIAAEPRLSARITDREALFGYLLLDVNVSSAVPTSRIIEATAALQLYISRALEGLEPDVSFIDRRGNDRRPALAAQWELDRDYRMWEANQKLQLYPQNYLEPELRQITSPEFDTLLQAVSGGDMGPDTVEAAVNAYMSALAGLCDLSLCSFFADRHTDGGVDGIENTTYHVLAKAKWEPGRFFYRKLDADFRTIAAMEEGPEDGAPWLKAMDWTYWQEVTLPLTFDLFSEVAVCVFRNRFYFFWIEIEERREQSGEAPRSIWRLHPRYMRCDQNALVGPMLKPGLFTHGDPGKGAVAVSLGDAFEWTGARPEMKGTYHPTRAPDNLYTYGVLDPQPNDSAPSGETLTVSFGIDLPEQTAEASPTDAANTRRSTSLHIRLSQEWSDAILDLNRAIDTAAEDSAPAGYTPVHPRLVSDFAVVADQYSQTIEHEVPNKLVARYEFSQPCPIKLHNGFAPGRVRSVATFVPAPRGASSAGSVKVQFEIGQGLYTLTTTDPDLDVLHLLEETKATPGSVVWTTEFRKHGERVGGSGSGATEWMPARFVRSDVPIPAPDRTGLRTASFSHPLNVQVSTGLSMFSGWTVGEGETGEYEIEAVLRRYPSPVTLLAGSPGAGETVAPEEAELRADLSVGTFVLRPANGLVNIGWTQTGQHGSRNFMHLVDRPDRTIGDTYVLANSSTVLADLARTMPRPGGCETLFELRNQGGTEDYGTFFHQYGATLGAIYGDDAALNPARLPTEAFDFDSAYGAYGWEVFYHLPAAIAAGYASGGQYDLALEWLRRIFDPQLDPAWRVQPLIDARDPGGLHAFDTGAVTIDPDRIAQDYPFYYQQAAIRSTLEVLIDAGDAEYEQETRDSLRRAKARYVAARQLFDDTLSDSLENVVNTPWTDPTLGAAATTEQDVFLPPYNAELRALYATIQDRLHNLRHWLTLAGEPLDVPLLAKPVDPRQLQRAAKASLALRGGSPDEDPEPAPPPVDFIYVLDSVRSCLGNLKLTSYRLQDTREKEADAQMRQLQMDASIAKAGRAIDLHDYVINAAERDVAIKGVQVAAATTAMAGLVAQMLLRTYDVVSRTAEAGFARVDVARTHLVNVASKISAALKSSIPDTFGLSTGGQNLEQADVVGCIHLISYFLYKKEARDKTAALRVSKGELLELSAKFSTLGFALTTASMDLSKAKAVLDHQRAVGEELDKQELAAQAVRDKWDEVFGGTRVYSPFRQDLERLYQQEWAVAQERCRLLVRLYDEETDRSDGASFITTSSIGGEPEKFSAPHRLALDVERLETAFIQAALDKASDTSEFTVALSEMPSLGQQTAALDELLAQGETCFRLTDEMVDVFYPGQYDRRIQSIAVRWPSLSDAGLRPYARLTQISNTCFLSPNRAAAGEARIRRDRYPMQSLSLGSCEVDSRLLQSPPGVLGRFQNTGLDSCWKLVIPTLQALHRDPKGHGAGAGMGRGAGRAWRSAAEARSKTLRGALTEIEFTVRFSGRWAP
ncbi:neuraminidase-like domain-containing protein [Salipiger sp. 1_MG-2023]|uniref:neuraminidase-like domain-containing protein n=1 Tax=Salipiger sp. 1_MG-2023 TaxID=3062665 RepID=UPI0026E2CF6B|nr:neuraminidase-like domain-containing protein [Salipiger sp. 1_MG-2023]MDO6587670.1 neuraminidase-like domain-containing protein [Salipiger sp. 1_MG-2023]